MNRFYAILAAAVLLLSISASAAFAGHGSHASGHSAAKKIKGHYTGASAAGHAISFDVKGHGSKLAVENLAVDVDTECWDDFDQDGAPDTLIAHVPSLDGNLRDGVLDIYFAPDDDTEYVVEGKIVKGKARLNVVVGGFWDANGFPSLSGPFQCDNWGDVYKAKRH